MKTLQQIEPRTLISSLPYEITSRGGTDAYDIATGNSMGQEINVFNSNALTEINHPNPWANFLY